jgi:hypothetical protein
MARLPWTPEELEKLIPKVKASLEELEAEDEDIRPLAPMTAEECKELFFRLLNTAITRMLTKNEIDILSQLLACFEMAIRAETLGKKGRYIVLHEDDIKRLVEEIT